MGKPRVIAETGAGQHGVATATIAARFGMECVVYMGSEDVRRQAANVYRMKLLGATVVPVESGSRTLKDALNEAMRDWVTNVESTFYIIGTVAGPHPYPMMVRDFQRVIGDELRVFLIFLVRGTQLVECVDQRFSDEHAAILAEMASFVRQVIHGNHSLSSVAQAQKPCA